MQKILVNKPGKSTIVFVTIPTGSFYESNYLKGISHFLEHMCFKGTPKRTQKEISSSIDNIGGDINAFTGEELTAYYAKVGNSYKNLAIDVITDLVQNPILSPKEIIKERSVIIQELKMYEDNPGSYVWNLFNESLYEKSSGCHMSPIGTQETLNRIHQKELKKYHKTYYNDAVLIIVGNVKNYSNYDRPIEPLLILPSLPKKGYQEKFEKRDDLAQANIIIGNNIQIKKYNHLEQNILLNLLDDIYSDMSGRLFNTIREENNLVYKVHFYCDIFRNGSIQWSVALGLDKKNIKKAQKLLIKAMNRPATSKEINIAINKNIGQIEMNLDNNKTTAKIIAERIAKGFKWDEYFINYKRNYKKLAKNINQFIKEMNFKNHILVGVVPK